MPDFAGDDASLWAAEQLVAAEAHEVSTALEHLARRGFVMTVRPFPGGQQRAAAKILDERHSLLARQCGQLMAFRLSDKAIHEKIASMHLEQQSGFLAGGLGIILQCGSVGGANFAQARAAGLENIRDAKAAADLHQFTARN